MKLRELYKKQIKLNYEGKFPITLMKDKKKIKLKKDKKTHLIQTK
jgi:hypothetical protein